ncbi:hypothetical protein Dimus_017914 [Dionaea muscipula]
MQRGTPARNPHTSTADLLTWSETPPPSSPSAATATSASRSLQPSDQISKVVFGGQVSDEEAQGLSKSSFRKPCSGYKMKEMTGSGIFSDNEGEIETELGGVGSNVSKTSVRIYQQALSGISQISFGAEESVAQKKPVSITEVAKQRELSGTLESESDMKGKKQLCLSDAKCKELSGNDIFAPPPENPSMSLAAARTQEIKERQNIEEPVPRSIRTSVKVSNPAGGQSNILFSEEPEITTAKKIHDQKFQELTGNGLFTGDAPPESADRSLSKAKLREMSGSDIFADGKAELRDHFGGVRKPPGGESSIALV